MALDGAETEDRRSSACLSRQTSRTRGSLPPLSIGRRSLEEWPKVASDDMDMAGWTAQATTPGRRRAKTGLDIKLDLSSVPRTPLEHSDVQLKRDKFAFYEKECSRVANYHIYLGSDAVAKNKETLKAHGITHVLNCVGFVCPEYFKDDFYYKTLWLQDSPGEDITSLLYDVFDYFEEVGELGGRVFVHCCQGISRSTSFVIAYMMWRESRSFEEALQDVKAARGVTNPNMGFACQLLQCQKRVHAAPMSPTSVLRMYRIAPYSPYDPLHLVPKAVMNPSAGALDSRGAFVIHVPVAIFVWIGCKCDSKMAQAARVAAAQVVRYERAQGSVHVVVEGSESDEFWHSLGKYAGLLDNVDSDQLNENRTEPGRQRKRGAENTLVEQTRNAAAGNRILSTYNADFQLYHRARQGGVVPPVPSTGVGVIGAPTRIPEREDGWSVLRRKFLSGELFPCREKEMETADFSPSSSGAFSSPLLSPFSSIATGSCTDSLSVSPLSQMSILSPDTPSHDSREQSEAGVPNFLTSKGSSLEDADAQRKSSFVDTELAIDEPKLIISNTAESLCRKTDEAQKICIVNKDNDMEMDDSSSNSRNHNVLWAPKAPLAQQCARDVTVAANDSLLVLDRARDTSQATWDSLIEAGEIFVYSWPELEADAIIGTEGTFLSAWPQPERQNTFVADQFRSGKAMIVVVVPQKVSNMDKPVVYTWLGRELHNQISNSNLPLQGIGRQFLSHFKCQTDAEIRVVKQGNEPEEFSAYMLQ